MGILVQHGMTPAAAVAYVRSLRPLCQPSTLLLSQMDTLLRLRGALVRALAGYVQARQRGGEVPIPIGLLLDRGQSIFECDQELFLLAACQAVRLFHDASRLSVS